MGKLRRTREDKRQSEENEEKIRPGNDGMGTKEVWNGDEMRREWMWRE